MWLADAHLELGRSKTTRDFLPETPLPQPMAPAPAQLHKPRTPRVIPDVRSLILFMQNISKTCLLYHQNASRTYPAPSSSKATTMVQGPGACDTATASYKPCGLSLFPSQLIFRSAGSDCRKVTSVLLGPLYISRGLLIALVIPEKPLTPAPPAPQPYVRSFSLLLTRDCAHASPVIRSLLSLDCPSSFQPQGLCTHTLFLPPGALDLQIFAQISSSSSAWFSHTRIRTHTHACTHTTGGLSDTFPS